MCKEAAVKNYLLHQDWVSTEESENRCKGPLNQLKHSNRVVKDCSTMFGPVLDRWTVSLSD